MNIHDVSFISIAFPGIRSQEEDGDHGASATHSSSPCAMGSDAWTNSGFVLAPLSCTGDTCSGNSLTSYAMDNQNSEEKRRVNILLQTFSTGESKQYAGISSH